MIEAQLRRCLWLHPAKVIQLICPEVVPRPIQLAVRTEARPQRDLWSDVQSNDRALLEWRGFARRLEKRGVRVGAAFRRPRADGPRRGVRRRAPSGIIHGILDQSGQLDSVVVLRLVADDRLADIARLGQVVEEVVIDGRDEERMKSVASQHRGLDDHPHRGREDVNVEVFNLLVPHGRRLRGRRLQVIDVQLEPGLRMRILGDVIERQAIRHPAFQIGERDVSGHTLRGSDGHRHFLHRGQILGRRNRNRVRERLSARRHRAHGR